MMTQYTPIPTRYSRVAIWLHWLLAAALAGQIALGFSMPHDASGFALFQLHKSIGITILVLSVVRLVWRFTHARPAPLEGGITGFLAKAVHFGFYAFMILGPLTGWAVVSTADVDVPTLVFGVIPVPHLPLSGGEDFWEEAHEVMSLIGMGLFVLHVVGALRHHFLMRDGLLARMAPGGKPGWALLLGALVIGIWALVPRAVGGDGKGDHDHEHDHGRDHAQEHGEHAPAAAALPEGEETPAAAEDTAAAEAEAAAALAAAATAEAASAESGPPPAWTIRPGGALRFTADNGAGGLHGSFSRWNGAIAFDPENPASAQITIRVELASASLGDATQDAMLQGDGFFNSAANPTATWRATRVAALGGGRYRAEGTLSLRGASRSQPITFTLTGTGNRRNVHGAGTIDRNAFGVGTGPDAEGIAGNVALDFTFDATS